MAQYTKEIKLSTAKGDYVKTLTGAYNVVFDKIIKVDNSTSGIDLVKYGTSVADDTMTAPKAILVENTGNVGCELMISTAEWTTDDATDSADTLADATHYLSMLLPSGECVYLPNNRLIGTSVNFGGGMGVAVDNAVPDSNEYIDSTADTTEGFADDNDTTITFDDASGGVAYQMFKVNDLIRIEDEICRITSIVDTAGDGAYTPAHFIVERALYGSAKADHSNNDAIRLPFFNMHHDFDDTSYNGGGNGSATIVKTNGSGLYRAMNFMGYGRLTTGVADGLVSGSVAIKFYEQGYQEFGLAGITSSTKTGLVVSTTYTITLSIDGSSTDDLAFTTDSSDVTFGNVIGKIQSVINEKFTAGTNLKGRKATIGIVNGDVRVTSGSRLSTSAIALGDASGTDPWGVGIIPAVAALETAVAGKLPDDTVRDSVTYAERKNTAAFLLDDGMGNLKGAGGSGTINYETGELNINAFSNAEFVVSANTKAAHCGGMEDSATLINGVVTLEARSCNQKADTEIRVISLG